MPGGDSKVLNAKKTILKSRYGMCLSIFLFLSVTRCMSPKSQTHKRCGTLRKKSFSAWGYAEIHIQWPFFDNKNSI
jgi:hypothetical protein